MVSTFSPPIGSVSKAVRDPLSRLQWLVFALVGAVFTTACIPQPVLPVLRQQFGVGEGSASLTVSAVVLGIALANLPFGALEMGAASPAG